MLGCGLGIRGGVVIVIKVCVFDVVIIVNVVIGYVIGIIVTMG